MAIKIGALAERTRTNAPTVRYYEEIGLLPPAPRRQGGQRRYGEEDVRRLTFIRRCREFGFPIEQVRVLAGLMQDAERSCMDAREMVRGHLDAVRAKRAELEALEESLAAFVDRCDTLCAGGPGPDCVVFDELATPAPSAIVRGT